MKLEFVRTLSSDVQNVVIGLVRNKVAAEGTFGEAVPKNLTFLQADITDLDALKVRELRDEAVVHSWAVTVEAG